MSRKAHLAIPALLFAALLVVACSGDGFVDPTMPAVPGAAGALGAEKGKPSNTPITAEFESGNFLSPAGEQEVSGTFNKRGISVGGPFALTIAFTAAEWEDINASVEPHDPPPNHDPSLPPHCDLESGGENYLVAVLGDQPVRTFTDGEIYINVDKRSVEATDGKYGVLVNYTVSTGGVEYLITTGGSENNDVSVNADGSWTMTKPGGFVRVNAPDGSTICHGLMSYTFTVSK